jgi:hypothetical protein
MLGFIGELLVELVGEFAAAFVSAAIGFVIGSVVFVIVRVCRRALLHLSGERDVVDPAGGRWVLRVPFAPDRLHTPLSRFFFAMRGSDRMRRRRGGQAPDSIAADEIVHPSGLLEATDEAAGCVAPLLLAGVLVVVALFALEALLLAMVAIVVFAVRLARSGWSVEITHPDGRMEAVPATSARAADAMVRDLERDILAGRDPTSGPAEPSG